MEPPLRGRGRRCSPWPRRWRHRSPPRSVRAASSRPGIVCRPASPANRIVHGAELLLFVGCDTGDQVTLNWRVPGLETAVVQIDADPVELGRSYPRTTGLVGDPKATVARLVQVIGRPARDTGFAEEAARIVADWRATMAPLIESDTAPARVERLCA